MLGLSILSRGTPDEKLRWTFSLYDINGDGYISKDEMKNVVTAIFELMGNCTEPIVEDSAVQDRVDRIFQVSLRPRTSQAGFTCSFKVLQGTIASKQGETSKLSFYNHCDTCHLPNENAVVSKLISVSCESILSVLHLQKMDQNHDGLVSMEEFLDCCSKDENITKSMSVFDSVI